MKGWTDSSAYGNAVLDSPYVNFPVNVFDIMRGARPLEESRLVTVRKILVVQAVMFAKGDQHRAARMLNTSSPSVWRWLRLMRLRPLDLYPNDLEELEGGS